jgi:hypothetical protein
MPDRLVLHIGMHKTGTTAIQKALDGYDDGTIRMARLGVPNHSIPMLTCYVADPTRYHVWVRQGLPATEVLRRRDYWRARLAEELALPREVLILSGEEMSLMKPASVSDMLDDLRLKARQTDVLGWLRPADSYIASAFQQQIRAGQKTLDLPRPRYRDRFAPYLDLVGRDRLALRLYDPARPAVAEFCETVGIPARSVDDITENASLSPDALRLVFRLNRDGPPTAGTQARLTARSRLLRHLSGRFDGRFTMPSEITVAGLDPADIAWAEALTGLSLHGGATGDPARASVLLRDWIEDIPDAVLNLLDEDLAILRIRLSPQAGPSEKVAALYLALLDEAEAQTALAPVFAAGRRGPPRATRSAPTDQP